MSVAYVIAVPGQLTLVASAVGLQNGIGHDEERDQNVSWLTLGFDGGGSQVEWRSSLCESRRIIIPCEQTLAFLLKQEKQVCALRMGLQLTHHGYKVTCHCSFTLIARTLQPITELLGTKSFLIGECKITMLVSSRPVSCPIFSCREHQGAPPANVHSLKYLASRWSNPSNN